MQQSDDILAAYLKVTQHMSQRLRVYFGRLNLTFPQALALGVLGEEGRVPISTLAERTGSANSTVSGIVDRLEKLGLAKRERSELDRRVIYVTVTEKYRRLRESTGANVRGYFAGLMENIGEEDRSAILGGLNKLDHALGQEEGDHGQ